jgi:hypothetical protein
MDETKEAKAADTSTGTVTIPAGFTLHIPEEDTYNTTTGLITVSRGFSTIGTECYPSGSRINNTTATGTTAPRNETYNVPLSLVSGIFRMSNILPLCGGELKVKIWLAPASEVIGYCTVETDTYQITNMQLRCDTVCFDEEYRKMIRAAAYSDEGFIIPFVSYQTGIVTCQANTLQQFRIPYNLANGLSLHIVRENDGTAGTGSNSLVATKWTCPKICYPMPFFSSITVRSGSKYFTPSEGITSTSELLRSLYLTHGNFTDIYGSGIIDAAVLTQDYKQHSSTGTGNLLAQAGFCPMSVSLEKGCEIDSDVTLNNGLNCGDGFNQIDVDIRTSKALAATDKLYYILVHKRFAKVSNNQVTCMF